MKAIGLRESLREQAASWVTLQDQASVIEQGDQYVLDVQNWDVADVYAFKEQHPDVAITYLVDEVTSAMTSFAAAHDIRLLHPDELLSFIQEKQDEKNATPILSFWGVYPRLGTTTLALSVANLLAAGQTRTVGVLGFNAYNAGHWLLSQRDNSLGDLISLLTMHKLNQETLMKSMQPISTGVSYLPGLRNQTQALLIQPEHVKELIHLAQALFDVVILDVGSVLNTALALEGMLQAKQRYVISNDLLSAQRQYFDHVDYVFKPLGLDLSSFLLIGNQVSNTKVTAFARTIELTPIAGIPYLPALGLYAEQQHDPLKFILGEKPFRKAAENIAASINL